MVTHQIINTAGKFDNVIHPSAILRSEFGDHAFIRKRLAGEIVVPSVTEVQVVLEKINVSQNMIENHDIHPIRIVVIVIGDRRPGVDNGLIRIARVQFITALFFQNFDVMDPVIIKGWNHHLGSQFQQISIGNNIFQRFILKIQTCIPGSFLAPFHDFFGMLVD